MIDLNAPAIKVVLQQLGSLGGQISGQQIGRLPVILAPVFAGAIAYRCYDQQAQHSSFAPALPVNLVELLVAHLPIASAMKNQGSLPTGHGIALAYLLRGELPLAKEAAALAQGALAQDNVFAAARGEADVLFAPIRGQNGAV